MRPLRKTINDSSLILMGVPKQFCDKTIKDFNHYSDPNLIQVKEFVKEYLKNIEYNITNSKGIFFYGSNGVGKSFLSCIILKEAYRHRFSCRRVTFSSYITAYTQSWGATRAERDLLEIDLHERYKGVEFLVLEEVGKEIDSKIAKPILEDLLRYREEHKLCTIICCNLSVDDFRAYYGNSICSLVNGNQTVIKIVAKDRRGDVFNEKL